MSGDPLTVPEVFTLVSNPRERTLYERVYSILVITGKLTEFKETPVNDLLRFVNMVGTHMPGIWERGEIEDGLRGVHYALREGPAMFLHNYCQDGNSDSDSGSDISTHNWIVGI